MTIKELKDYALLNKIPIITDEALTFILNYIKINKVKRVLEIGSAIGYSAICFTEAGAEVETFERDTTRILEAKKFIELFKARVKLYEVDALEYQEELGQYDLIFIDAAKAQYEKFFQKFKRNLAPNGVIICDNLNFHNLDITTVSKSTKQLIIKLNKFKDFLRNNTEFVTQFYDLGDGLTVSKRV